MKNEIKFPHKQFLKKCSLIKLTGVNSITSVLYLESQDKIVVASYSPYVFFFDNNLGFPTNSIETNKYGNRALHNYTKDREEYLLIGSYENIYIASLTTYQVLAFIAEPEQIWITSVIYAPNQQYYITGSKNLRIYQSVEGNLQNMFLVHSFTNDVNLNSINSLLLIKPNLTTLVVGLSSKKISFILLETFEVLGEIETNASFYNSIIQIDDTHILTDSWHGVLYLYSIETYTQERQIKIAGLNTLSLIQIDASHIFYYNNVQIGGIINLETEEIPLKIKVLIPGSARGSFIEKASAVYPRGWGNIIIGVGSNNIMKVQLEE